MCNQCEVDFWKVIFGVDHFYMALQFVIIDLDTDDINLTISRLASKRFKSKAWYNATRYHRRKHILELEFKDGSQITITRGARLDSQDSLKPRVWVTAEGVRHDVLSIIRDRRGRYVRRDKESLA